MANATETTIIHSSAPLRVTLAGGGSDLPGSPIPSHLLAVAIGQRVTVAVRAAAPPTDTAPATLLDLFAARNPGYRADVVSRSPSGAGLGGSGALAVALVWAETAIRRVGRVDPTSLALEAWRWENGLLRRPVGYQDQVIAAHGGVVEMSAPDPERLRCDRRPDLAAAFDALSAAHLLLVDTGLRHDAAEVSRGVGRSPTYRTPLREIEACVLARDWDGYADLLNQQWRAKTQANPRVTNAAIDGLIADLRDVGVAGAKLIGAGGGGFLQCCMAAERRQDVERWCAQAARAVLSPAVSPTGVQLDHVVAGSGSRF